MDTRFIEAGNDFNWGKFCIARFDPEEWHRPSHLPKFEGGRLLVGRGWDPRRHTFVMDLQTGEGAMFGLGGHARNDLLEKHAIWTCPLFPYFLEWLYGHYNEHPETWWGLLPPYVDLEALGAIAGQRGRGGQ